MHYLPVAIDPATGLPELPENHFWRVYQSSASSPYLRVSIFRRDTHSREVGVFHKRIQQTVSEVEVEWTALYNFEANEAQIKKDAIYVYQKFRGAFPKHNWQQYLGDYPPKTLV